ncbi:MAG TPA: flagellar motor switch protein FliN [Actinobacteria bacterium]|nr:flagellar motor switch protein FliN [Actinomycetota bacterium]
MPEKSEEKNEFTETDLNNIGNAFNTIVAALAKVISDFSGKKSESLILLIVQSTREDYTNEKKENIVLAQLNCTGGLNGDVLLILQEEDGVKLAELAQQQELSGGASVDEMGQDVLKEVFNQVAGETTSNFTAIIGQEVTCSLAQFKVSKLADEAEALNASFPDDSIVKAGMNLNIEGVSSPVQVDSIVSVAFSEQLINIFGETKSEEAIVEAEQTPEESEEPEEPKEPGGNVEAEVPVEQVHFDSLSAGGKRGDMRNINLLLDVSLVASIELGRTNMTVQEILNLGGGSVIELDKLASEPVDFLINGKVIARGEVVVIDDKFGVRVTDIADARERLESI